MEREYLSWRGHRICVTDRGTGDPLLLVPGLGCNAEMWLPFMEHFPHRRMISFDAPGAGRSSLPLYPVSVESLAALTIAVLDDRGVSVADVIGFSYGGAVAQQLAYDYPERVGRLVLAATTCGYGAVLGSFEALATLATPLRFYSQRYFERVAAGIYGGVTGRDPVRREQAMAMRHRIPPTSYGYAMQLLGGMGWSSFGFLPRHSRMRRSSFAVTTIRSSPSSTAKCSPSGFRGPRSTSSSRPVICCCGTSRRALRRRSSGSSKPTNACSVV